MGEWFDLWHVHPNTEDTAERWAGLVAAWARAVAAGRLSGRPWQTWLVIEPTEPREDAAYLHTPNPNRDNFLYPFEGVEWGAEPPGWVAASEGLQFGQSSYGGAELLWVRRPQEAEPGTAAEGGA